MREPTGKEIAEMALAAITAAKDKADELGLEWFFFMLGIERAYESVEATAEIINAIGVEAAVKLGMAIQKSELYDMMKEAESALKEEDK